MRERNVQRDQDCHSFGTVMGLVGLAVLLFFLMYLSVFLLQREHRYMPIKNNTKSIFEINRSTDVNIFE